MNLQPKLSGHWRRNFSSGKEDSEMPRVTVIIPAYNSMEFLPETLASVLQQTFTDFEVLIINDGSTDHIVSWASGIHDPRVKLISQENRGVSEARNTGIKNAQGEYVAFLDSDDLWEATKLEAQVQCLDSDLSAGVVYTWTRLINKTGEATGRIFASDPKANVWQQLLEKDVISTGSSVMTRRSCFERVGYFDRTLPPAEDLDMWLRLAAHYPFSVIKEPLTLYRYYPNSSSKNRQKMLQSLIAVVEKTFQTVPIEMLPFRNRAYSSILLNQAWWSVDEGDCKTAKHWCRQALLHYPQAKLSEKYIRLSLAIFLNQWFGSNGYNSVRHLTHYIRDMILKKV